MPSSVSNRRARLLESREIAPEVRHFVFEVPGQEQLDFLPGQFVSLTEEIGGKAITRAYSTAAPPAGNRFELCLNRVQDGCFSPFLFELRPGDEVPVKGIYGVFTLRSRERDALMVATGTGIAPIRGMLMDLWSKGSTARVRLLFGVRHEHALLYREEFEQMQREHPSFDFWPTLTRPEAGWNGRTGRVQAHLDEALEGRKDVDVYICGLRAMVDDVRARLKEGGYDRKQIIAEKYD